MANGGTGETVQEETIQEETILEQTVHEKTVLCADTAEWNETLHQCEGMTHMFDVCQNSNYCG